MNDATFLLNMTHKDPSMRKMLGNKDFRIGLSYALDRQEIVRDEHPLLISARVRDDEIEGWGSSARWRGRAS